MRNEAIVNYIHDRWTLKRLKYLKLLKPSSFIGVFTLLCTTKTDFRKFTPSPISKPTPFLPTPSISKNKKNMSYLPLSIHIPHPQSSIMSTSPSIHPNPHPYLPSHQYHPLPTPSIS